MEHNPRFAVVPFDRQTHTEAVVSLDAQWVAENTAPWREGPRTQASIAKTAARPDVYFVVLIDHHAEPKLCTGSALTSRKVKVVGHAWADFTEDSRACNS